MRAAPSTVCAIVVALSVTVAISTSAIASEDPPVPSTVTIHRELDRLVFADATGMTLYTYDKDQDTPGTSNCTLDRHCSRRWPPLLATAGAEAVGDWTVILRQDGQPQWAYKGQPVYRSVDDLTPGSTSGDNARRLWHVAALPLPAPKVTVPAGFQVVKGDTAWVYADYQGRVLYAPDPRRSCDETCREWWQPVPAAMLAREVGDWKPISVDDGALQWSFRGRLLYALRADGAMPEAEASALRVVAVAPDAP